MAFLENQGVKIYWDEQGAGEPILLIMGLSYPSYMWHRTRPGLAARYRTVAFDNRGVGRSDVPPGPYSILMMAADAAAALDAAGVDTAHILGFSMGGMIAQEFALRYPQRVKSLVLGCTSPGGPQSVQAAPEVVQLLLSRGVMSPAEANEAMIPFIYDRATSRELIDEDMAIRMKWYPTPEGYMGQLQAIFGWEALPLRANHRAHSRRSWRNRSSRAHRKRQADRRQNPRRKASSAPPSQPHFYFRPACRQPAGHPRFSPRPFRHRPPRAGLVHCPLQFVPWLLVSVYLPLVALETALRSVAAFSFHPPIL